MKKRFGDRAYIQSCGISSGEIDDLMVAVMREKGIDMASHTSRDLASLGDTSFDVVIAFTKEAGETAKTFFDGTSAEIEVWPLPDPTSGMLDVRAMMNNYRAVRDRIEMLIEKRFGSPDVSPKS